MDYGNILERIYYERATDLVVKLRNADSVSHSTTVGELRELAIINSLNDIIPDAFEINTGFVVDAKGNISPQIDILIYQPGELTPILLSKYSVVLPFELFRIGMEVKSNVKTEHFDQIAQQTSSLASMWNSAFLADPSPYNNHKTFEFQKPALPYYLISAESELSIDKLMEKLETTDGLSGILVINKCLLQKGLKESYSDESCEYRIVRFWAYINEHCQNLSTYLTITEKDKENILKKVNEELPDLDTSQERIKRWVFDRIKRPSLIPYLFPGRSKGKE